MSYSNYNSHQGFPQQGYAPQQNGAGAYPAQGNYGSSPVGGFPQQNTSHHTAPPQQGYGAPPQQGYGAPQQGYGAPQQGYGAPQQGYGAPQQGYNAPTAAYAHQVPQMAYGSTPQQAWVPPAAPFDPSYNADADVEVLRKATKGFGTDEKALIMVLAQKTPARTLQLSQRFEQLVGKSLIAVIEKETSKWFCFGLVGCASGPLDWDVALLHRAMKGMGTHEDLLTELLIGRPNAEIHELKYAYEQKYHKALQTAVQGELSMKTERMFNMALTGRRDEEHLPIDHTRVQADIQTLYNSSSKRMGTDEIAVCGILLSRSDNHLRAVAQGYMASHRRTVPEMVRSEFSGHMKEALLHAIDGAIDRAGRDANLLEDAMKGLGTKDERLTYRIVRMHWNQQHTNTVKAAYQHIYRKDLVSRIKGETSGDHERLLVACLQV